MARTRVSIGKTKFDKSKFGIAVNMLFITKPKDNTKTKECVSYIFEEIESIEFFDIFLMATPHHLMQSHCVASTQLVDQSLMESVASKSASW